MNQEKAVIELKRAQKIANNVAYKLIQSVDRCIPLLEKSIIGLKQKIAKIEPEFKKLRTIRNNFKQEIEQAKNEQSRAIANTFVNYIFKLKKLFKQTF